MRARRLLLVREPRKARLAPLLTLLSILSLGLITLGLAVRPADSRPQPAQSQPSQPSPHSEPAGRPFEGFLREPLPANPPRQSHWM